MRENRLSGSEGGGTKPIASPYPYFHNGPSDLTGRQIPLEILAFQEERCYKPLALSHFSHRRLTAMTTLVAGLLALMARHETHWQLTNRETI